MLTVQNLTYIHPNKDLLFDNISLSANNYDKIALIGNNGSGKSTLLKIIAGLLQPSDGGVRTSSRPYYIPQLVGQFNGITIAEALRVEDKFKALNEILGGNITEQNMALLNDDWTIEERCREALTYWKLDNFDLRQKMDSLSGGQKTKVFLAGILIHRPRIILLDEPNNHLDRDGRRLLYDFLRSYSSISLVVSHDRELLNLLNSVYELSNRGITVYGGNYDFYAEQKLIEQNAMNQDVRSREKALRKAKEVERETEERKQKLDARGKKKQQKAGVPAIALNTLRNNAERSSSRLKGVHVEKVNMISQELSGLRKDLPDIDKIKLGFDDSKLYRGKVLLTAKEVNYGYADALLWTDPLSFQITSGERIAIKGSNGSGKTTLIKLILGDIEPKKGCVNRADTKAVYIDQDYSLIDGDLSVYDQAEKFNFSALQEHEIKIRLSRFLFTKDYWDKPCIHLSGGERMRLMLCCLTISNKAPDIIVLDEPTNNLDLQNIEILTAAISEYKGTIIVISHDEYFLKQTGVEKTIVLN